jgi:catechol 2,3-dioxygenase-like lactoylglutathione lyase family enzyme
VVVFAAGLFYTLPMHEPPADSLGAWPGLVPELLVTNLAASLGFYVEAVGFDVVDRRSDPEFALVRLGTSLIMLEQVEPGGWITGELEAPFGRGVNFEIEHSDPVGLADRLEAAGATLFRPLRRTEYVSRGETVAQWEFLICDPDGYLLRFVHED